MLNPIFVWYALSRISGAMCQKVYEGDWEAKKRAAITPDQV